MRNKKYTGRQRVVFTIISICLLLLLLSCKEQQPQPHYHFESDAPKTDILRVYCTESFATSELGTTAVAEFEKQFSCYVELLPLADEVALLNRLIAEKFNPQADIVIGIKNIQMFTAFEHDLFQQYEASNLTFIANRSLMIDRRFLLTPLAYSYYGFLYDSHIVLDPPKTIGEVQSSIWKDKVVITNPNTSTAGHSLILWALNLFGERGYDQFWKSLAGKLLIVDNITDAYNLLRLGDVPIVLSNLTSFAMFDEQEEPDRYKTIAPAEGSLKEIDYAGILKSAENIYLARRFVEFMLTPEFQKYVPTSLWMFPVIDRIQTPESFSTIRMPAVDLTNNIHERREYFQKRWVEQWSKIMLP